MVPFWGGYGCISLYLVVMVMFTFISLQPLLAFVPSLQDSNLSFTHNFAHKKIHVQLCCLHRTFTPNFFTHNISHTCLLCFVKVQTSCGKLEANSLLGYWLFQFWSCLAISCFSILQHVTMLKLTLKLIYGTCDWAASGSVMANSFEGNSWCLLGQIGDNLSFFGGFGCNFGQTCVVARIWWLYRALQLKLRTHINLLRAGWWWQCWGALLWQQWLNPLNFAGVCPIQKIVFKTETIETRAENMASGGETQTDVDENQQNVQLQLGSRWSGLYEHRVLQNPRQTHCKSGIFMICNVRTNLDWVASK